MRRAEKAEEEGDAGWWQRPDRDKEEEEVTDEVICAVEFGETTPLAAAPSIAALSDRGSATTGAGRPSRGTAAAAAADKARGTAAGSRSSSSAGGGEAAKVTSVGVCVFQRAAFKLRFCEFYTTTDISLLEALLLQVRPGCVISSEGGSSNRTSRGSSSAAAAACSAAASTRGWEKKLRDVAEATGACYIQLPKGARDTRGLLQDLENLLRPGDELKNHIAKELLLRTACAACASLLFYTRLLSDDAYVKQCALDTYPTDLYLQVDTAAAAALYLFPSLALQRRQQQQLAAAGPLLQSAADSASVDKDSAPAGAYIRRTSAAAAAASSSSSPGVSSVYALLARWTGTSLGARRLFAVLSQPLVDRQEIDRRLDIVEIFHTEDAFRRVVFTSHFKHVFDLDALAAKLHRVAAASSLGEEGGEDQQREQPEGREATATAAANRSSSLSSKRSALIARARLGLESLVRLYNCVLEASSLQKTLLGYNGVHARTLEEDYGEPLAATVAAFKPFLELIDFTIDSEEAARGCFVVKREFDPQLAALLQERAGVQRLMQQERQRVEQLLPLENRKRDTEAVRLTEDATMGFVLRVTKKDQAAVLSHQHSERGVGSSSSRLQVLRVNKSEVLFTTTELKQQCGRYKDLCEAVETAQQAVVEKVLCVAASYWPVVEKLAELIGMLDVLGAFAAAANAAPLPYVRPKFLDEATAGSRIALLENCRHPLVEQQAGTCAFISNDVLFDREEARVHVVTGPNMGGKSTYIRQAALAVVLAQSGCFVPCSRCELIPFKRVLCRVGASDIQLRGVSTFLSEMLEASSVLRHAQKDSLVIVDEIGRGTSTYEGFGLAWAIAKELAERTGCCCLFATHFHEMGLLAGEVKGVINSHVAAAFNPSSKELTFLYKVERGAADQSYGVLVAQYAGLPAAVVRRAAAKARELEAMERGGEKSSSSCIDTGSTSSSSDEGGGEVRKLQHLSQVEEDTAVTSGSVATPAKDVVEKSAAAAAAPAEEGEQHGKGPHASAAAGLTPSGSRERRPARREENGRKEEEVRGEGGEEREAKRKKSTDSPSVGGAQSDGTRGGSSRSSTGQPPLGSDTGKPGAAAVAAENEDSGDRRTSHRDRDANAAAAEERTRAWQQLRQILRDAFAAGDAQTFAAKVQSSSEALRGLRRKVAAPELTWGSSQNSIPA